MKRLSLSIINKVQNCKGAYIFVHISPDGDCVSCALEVAYSFFKVGKEAIVFTDNLEKFIYEKDKISTLLSTNIKTDTEQKQKYFDKITIKDNFDCIQFNSDFLIIMTDCGEFSRIGKFYELLINNSVTNDILKHSLVVIDHHINKAKITNFSYVDELATSASELCYYLLLKAFNLNQDLILSMIAAFGISSDTGFFRFVRGNKNGARLFRTISHFIDNGVEMNMVYAIINSERDKNSNLYLSKMLNNARYVKSSKGLFALVRDDRGCFENYGVINRPSLLLFDLLLSVKDVDFVIYLKYSKKPGFTDASVRVSARSNFNANLFCKNFSGGGHEKASGFSYEEDMDRVEEKVLNLLK